ncbi:magnesium transporter CorA family protein [Bradyrhizobium sp. 38]|uniref:magnesium transporter CorA family protein n=1 Tax=unclassified Bradyrhizobium TaxID=2631580 RepID=UPI001FF7003D|nr:MULTISPECIES: magnesium transporter CorA family protein [unclassified Bradyrhizobium]MCK1340921.1 magnesium transporter CorA family protein [Bradyrhizobium sp. 38]MCK1780783.1 magnesium transporter CorA family protein [Bradyrhizobium sp. 132]
MLKLYRWPSDDWQNIGAEMPSEIIWADLLDATAEEKQFVERLLKIRIPSAESLSEIEASSRLIFEHGTLYLSAPAVRLNEDNEAEITPVGFVIGPHVLVTVRFAPLPIFDDIGKRIGSDDSLENGMCVFTSLIEAMVDRGADILEHLGAKVDRLSRGVFTGGLVRSKRPVRSSRRMREALENIGELADRLAKARDVLLGVGRIASFAGDVGSEWITAASKKRLEAVSKDVVSLGDYETRLSDKIQLLLDAVLGFINIQQNELFKILTIVSVVGVPPTILVGIWGMNFKHMPELDWTFGYPLAWLAIIASGVLPLIWFRRRGWFE